MRRALGLFLALLGLVTVACGSATPPDRVALRGEVEPAPGAVEANIVHGEPVPDAPSWAVYVEIDLGNNRTGICSGSLITTQVVLTAAHCVELEDGTIAAPTALWTLTGAGALVGPIGTPRNVTKVDVHPLRKHQYDQNGSIEESSYDVALLTLDQPIEASPLPLAVSPDSFTPGPIVAFGYGLVIPRTPDNPEGVRSDILRASPLGKLEIAACEKWDLAADHVCMGSAEPDIWGVAPGDSGGPWVRTARGGTVQVAVTSYGAVQTPADAVGTNALEVLPWIRSTAGLLQGTSSTILKEPVTGAAWRVQPDGYRKAVPNPEELDCMVAAGAVIAEHSFVTIQQVPEAVDEIDSCTAYKADIATPPTTTTTTTTAPAPTTSALAPTTTVATAVLAAAETPDSDDLAVTGSEIRPVIAGALLLVGAGLALAALRARRQSAVVHR